MPRKIDDRLIDHAASLVLDGMTFMDIGKQIGVHHVTISRLLKKRGIGPAPRKVQDTLNLPVERIKSMYQDGQSENAISKHFGVSRSPIRKVLLRAGVSPRTQSEAEKLKWSQMDEETRANQVKNAHIANTGVTKTVEHRMNMAKTRERLKYDFLIGHGEVEFCKLLSDRGIDFTHQKAAHTYNIDIASGSIAMELSSDRGRYAMFNPKEIKRAENLLKCGYHTVAIEFDSVDTLIVCADNILAYVDEARSLGPSNREYWVIRCRAQNYTIIKNKLGQFASVPSPVKFLVKRTVINLD